MHTNSIYSSTYLTLSIAAVRRPVGPLGPMGPPAGRCRCAHPPTRRRLGLPAIIDRSEEHDSSGSTVDTFLPQGDLRKDYANLDDLESIAEVSDASED